MTFGVYLSKSRKPYNTLKSGSKYLCDDSHLIYMKTYNTLISGPKYLCDDRHLIDKEKKNAGE